jgi:hypothetical protein
MKGITNSENSDFVICSLCNRGDKLSEDPDNLNACAMCGGFGFITREKQVSKKIRRYTREKEERPVRHSD